MNPYYTIVKSHEKRKGDVADLYTIGYFDEDGDWECESDEDNLENAIARCKMLNDDWQRNFVPKICKFHFWRIIRAEYEKSPNILDDHYHALFFAAIRLSEDELTILAAAYPGLVDVVKSYILDYNNDVIKHIK